MDTIYTTRAEIEGMALCDPTFDNCEIVECDGGFKFEKNNFQTENFKNDVANVATLTLDVYGLLSFCKHISHLDIRYDWHTYIRFI